MVKTFSHTKRQKVWIKTLGRCAYCGKLLVWNTFHIDHVLPLRRGGTNAYANLLASCPPCNMTKKSRTPEEFKQYFLKGTKAALTRAIDLLRSTPYPKTDALLGFIEDLESLREKAETIPTGPFFYETNPLENLFKEQPDE